MTSHSELLFTGLDHLNVVDDDNEALVLHWVEEKGFQHQAVWGNQPHDLSKDLQEILSLNYLVVSLNSPWSDEEKEQPQFIGKGLKGTMDLRLWNST